MAYVLGFRFADGNMRISKSYRIRFFSQNQILLKKINQALDSDSKLILDARGNVYTLIVRSKKLYKDLSLLGGTPAKSTKIRFPIVPKKYLADFVRGYFDRDGSVHKIKYKASKNGKTYTEIRSNFTSGSKPFLVSLRSKLNNNIRLKMRAIGQYGQHQFKLDYGQKDTYKLLNFMYYKNHILSLKSKAIYLQYFQKGPSV